MNERQRDAIRKFGGNPCCDSSTEEKFRKEFYGNRGPDKKDVPKKENEESKAKPS